MSGRAQSTVGIFPSSLRIAWAVARARASSRLEIGSSMTTMVSSRSRCSREAKKKASAKGVAVACAESRSERWTGGRGRAQGHGAVVHANTVGRARDSTCIRGSELVECEVRIEGVKEAVDRSLRSAKDTGAVLVQCSADVGLLLLCFGLLLLRCQVVPASGVDLRLKTGAGRSAGAPAVLAPSWALPAVACSLASRTEEFCSTREALKVSAASASSR